MPKFRIVSPLVVLGEPGDVVEIAESDPVNVRALVKGRALVPVKPKRRKKADDDVPVDEAAPTDDIGGDA